MLRKNEIVALESNGTKQDFDGQHAENILTAPNNTGPGQWTLPKGSKYQLENGKLIRSATAKPDSSPEK